MSKINTTAAAMEKIYTAYETARREYEESSARQIALTDRIWERNDKGWVIKDREVRIAMLEQYNVLVDETQVCARKCRRTGRRVVRILPELKAAGYQFDERFLSIITR